jgi:uncharacterized YkwD family protein/spore coat assembly protein SafA
MIMQFNFKFKLLAALALLIMAIQLLLAANGGSQSVFNVFGTGCPNCGKENACVYGNGEAAPVTYTVQSGDSLWKIAVRFEIGVSELAKANPHIKNLNLIYPGQKLTIPEGAPLASLEQEVIRLVNAERAKNGLGALQYNWQAARVARIKSQDMISNKYFNHYSPVYGSPFKMLEDFGLKFSAAAENIAKGQRTPQEVMNSWMNSAGHRANILSRNVTQIGVGAAKDSNGTLVWTQIFIKPI